MKFASIAFIIGLCIVAVTANATDNFNIDNEDFELDYGLESQEFLEDITELKARTSFRFSLIRVLRTIKGLNCAIKEVIVIRNAASTLVDDIKACGGEVSKKVQNLIDACNNIIDTSKAILGINESICGNTTDENEIQSRTWHVVSGAQNAHKCFVQIAKKLRKLNRQVKTTAKLIKKIKDVPADTSKCVLDSIDALATHFTDFSGNVVNCSKLTSN